MQIIALQQEIVCSSGDSGNLTLHILCEHGNMGTHLHINGLFVLFPHEAVSFCVQFALDLTEGNQDTVIVLMLLTQRLQEFEHPLPLLL